MNPEPVVVDVDGSDALGDEEASFGEVHEVPGSGALHLSVGEGNIRDSSIVEDAPQISEHRVDATVLRVSSPSRYSSASRQKRTRSPSRSPGYEQLERGSRSATVASAIDDCDKNCCCICLEPWTNSGDHRLVCLPCGHLLGDSCAKNVLRLNKKCPICKAKGSYKHVRFIYGAAMDLRVVVAPELDKVKDDLKLQRKEYKTLKKKYEALKGEKQRLKDMLFRFEERDRLSRAQTSHVFKRTRGENTDVASSASQRRGGLRVAPKFSLDVLGNASALAFDPAGSILLSEAGPGGSTVSVRRVSLGAPELLIRSPPFPGTVVRCLAVCPHAQSYRGYIAAGFSDKLLRVLDQNLHVATSFTLDAVPTSCIWLSTHPSVLLCGLQNGELAAFDVSSSSLEALKVLRLPGDRSAPPAVHSLVHLASAQLPVGCIFAASLRGSAVISFAETAAFNMDVDAVTGFDNCAAASSFDNALLLSSRRGTAGKHCLFMSFSRVHARAAAEASIALGEPEVDDVIGGYSALAPFQRSSLLRLRSGKYLVASNDGKGLRLWIKKSTSNPGEQHWESLLLSEEDIAGPVRALSAILSPSRRPDMPAVLAVLCDTRISTFNILWE